MNIAIDVLAILGPDSKNRGIGNYTTSQLKNLFAQDKENKYFLLNFYEDTKLKDILNYGDNVSEYYYYLGEDGFLGRNEDFNEIFGLLIRNFLKKNKIDSFYFTSPFDSLISYDLEWFSNVKTVATLYDIIPYIFKDRYLPDKIHYKNYMKQIKKLLKMDKLLAISESAKDDVLKNFDYKSENIDVIYAGTDEWFKTISVNPIERENIRNTYNIKDEFIMCTGGDDDRKNIGDLIIAYSKMPKELIERFQLVVACKLSQQSERRYYDLAKKHSVRNRVILTNFVPTEHLVLLYNLAYVVAFPSKYEGFGLPVVEAMACGTPVLTSNNSSLGEIAEGAAVLVDPFDVNDISRGLIEILEYNNLQSLVEKGYERIKLFTWEKVAQGTLNSFSYTDYKEMKEIVKNPIKKLAFFTPLPPLQSGISDYSADILEGLSSYFDIDVYIDSEYTATQLDNPKIKIFEHTLFNKKIEEYDEIIYQMGNSEYHRYMMSYIKKYSGIVVLHDSNLHGLLYHLSMLNHDYTMYKNFLYEDYEKEFINQYVDDLVNGLTHPKIYEIATNGIVTNYAKKIIVHSDYAKKQLLNSNISRDVRKILHYTEIKDLNIRERHIPKDKLILSAFGHIHETKRVMQILEAFKNLCLTYSNIHLNLVGKPAIIIEEDIQKFIKEYNLSSKVTITGYVDLNEFEEFMNITDICLNLRYPYNGETSGSLMRVLSKGKCTIINDLGSFSEIPNDCCIKLKSPEFMTVDEEIQQIFTSIEDLVLNPIKITKIGNNARKYAEENLNILKIVDEYKDYINSNILKNDLNNNILSGVVTHMINHYGITTNEVYKISKTLASIKI
ncbi:glycosyltransferase [Lysinibacillus pakistanensis]|uniref:Glycosyltransferase n=1 Tax=Lysinibacillus pakistanensis TaxID=759811 RepID=A0ABX6DAG4_9BACI|nr:glycosyltransferase [Lysinibacillus pakistanensis]